MQRPGAGPHVSQGGSPDPAVSPGRPLNILYSIRPAPGSAESAVCSVDVIEVGKIG